MPAHYEYNAWMDRKHENIKIEYPAKNDAKKNDKKNNAQIAYFLPLIISFSKNLLTTFCSIKWMWVEADMNPVSGDLNDSILPVRTKQSKVLPSSIMSPPKK